MRALITVLLIVLCCSVAVAKKKQNKIIFKKSKCFAGFLYYDWVGRHKFETIPVLRNNKFVKCDTGWE
jgi:hypothetical protein